MTQEEWNAKWVRHGQVDHRAPAYLEEDREVARLRWIKWRNRIYKVLFRLRLTGPERYDIRRADAIMDYVWPFPTGTWARKE